MTTIIQYCSLILFILLIFIRPVFSESPGITSADFLTIYSDARPAALGEAYTALADDAAGMDFNPAGLMMAQHREFSASYIDWFDDASFQHLSYTHPPSSSDWAFGTSLIYFDAGEFMKTNELGLPTGERISARDISASIGTARNIGRFLSFGISFKYIDRRLYLHSASTGAVDIGLIYRSPINNLNIGASVLNLGGKLKFISVDEKLPLTFRMGVSYKTWFDKIVLTADAVKISDESFKASAGIEAEVIESIKLRTGWRNDDTLIKGFSAGVGFSISSIYIDYAYVPFDVLGSSHRVTGSVRFGGPTQPDIKRVPWPK